MPAYHKTLDFLYGLQSRGMKFGLHNIRELLDSVGNPHTRFPSIHVAGTNGKGSTSAFIASALMEHGLVTGLYTSPHLVRFTERIRIDGKEMPSRRLAFYANRIRPEIERLRATFFEATTCICFMYFADEGVDIGVIETGLGGRLDSTNVLLPLISVITNVSPEHQEYLGRTVRAIAREKGGIIKPGIPCVTGARDPSVLTVLRAIARTRGSRLYFARSVKGHENLATKGVVYTSPTIGRIALRPGLPGWFQVENGRLALATLDVLSKKGILGRGGIRAATIAKGFANVVSNVGLRGRFERIGKHWILDAAHNPGGMKALVRTLKERHVKISSVIFGVLKDKESKEMLRFLRGISPGVTAVAPGTERAKPVEEIMKECRELSIPVTTSPGVGAGLSAALRTIGGNELVLVTGSHYVVGEALAWLRRKKLDNT